jgi:hypothetical protein
VRRTRNPQCLFDSLSALRKSSIDHGSENITGCFLVPGCCRGCWTAARRCCFRGWAAVEGGLIIPAISLGERSAHARGGVRMYAWVVSSMCKPILGLHITHVER